MTRYTLKVNVPNLGWALAVQTANREYVVRDSLTEIAYLMGENK